MKEKTHKNDTLDSEDTVKDTEKSIKFKEIAEKRVNNTINEIRKLSKCSNTRTYEYSRTDVWRMFGSIQKELRRAKEEYQKGLDNQGKTKFKF
tara:strand:- start:60 stop:338 length:279 start_codon:yes stop_codon:yes gene_type:complete